MTTVSKGLLRKRTLQAFLEFLFWTAFFLAIWWHSMKGLGLGITKILLMASLLSLVIAATQWERFSDRVRTYSVLIDERAICTISSADGSYSVLRGRIRTVLEKRNGLYLSEKSGLRARLHGYVWIPKELSNYPPLKGLALSWRDPSAE
jgi:hypothetical protein